MNKADLGRFGNEQRTATNSNDEECRQWGLFWRFFLFVLLIVSRRKDDESVWLTFYLARNT
jgi:hypothetical protein